MNKNTREATLAVTRTLDVHLAHDASPALTLALYDALDPFMPAESTTTGHDNLALSALASPKVMAPVLLGKKIQAIKELRFLTNCGLKEAKDAIEDDRVAFFMGLTARPADPWTAHHDRDEPPF